MNKQQELLNKADELIKKANELKELAKQDEEIIDEDIIYVPDCIKLHNGDYSIGIINGEQELFYCDDVWNVCRGYGRTNKFKLVKCNYDDLKPGDVFYASDDNLKDIERLEYYNIKLSDGSYQYWNDKDCLNDDCTREYYYKVVLAE